MGLMPLSYRLALRWRLLLLELGMLDCELGRGPWIWCGRVGISFKRLWSFRLRRMVKIGATRGITVMMFGPLCVTWAS